MERLIKDPVHRSELSTLPEPPRILVQFWDDAQAIPADVQACIDTWAPLCDLGFERLLFDDSSAELFIKQHFTARHLAAFKRCQHPAMRSDYFRLCFMMQAGGLYADADDAYQGAPVEPYFHDGRLKLQPLCYDVTTDSMVEQPHLIDEPDVRSRIYYVNNNPLIVSKQHPIIAKALERATGLVLHSNVNNRDVQSLTGPGNLTACLVAHCFALEQQGSARDFEFLTDWATVAVSTWPLAYRSGHRNWRNWVRGQ